jgi:hypothetical protein
VKSERNSLSKGQIQREVRIGHKVLEYSDIGAREMPKLPRILPPRMSGATTTSVPLVVGCLRRINHEPSPMDIVRNVS